MLTSANQTKDYMPRDPRYFHPTEVKTLQRDASRAREELGWVKKITVQELCAEMVAHDLADGIKHALLNVSGYQVNDSVG